MTALLETSDLNKHFDGVKALDRFSSTVSHGEILGLIGPNGAGKTTLFNVVTGFLSPDSGTVLFKGRDLTARAPHKIAAAGISRTFQNLRLIRRLSVLDNVLLAYKNQPGESLSRLFFSWRRCNSVEAANREKALALLAKAGIRDKAFDLAEALSYGQQKLLSLVCCLAAGAELLLLDEPVAGIAPEMIDRMLSVIRALPAEGKTVILIEHNLGAVMQVCDRVIFMDQGAKVSEGTPDAVRNDPLVIEAYLD